MSPPTSGTRSEGSSLSAVRAALRFFDKLRGGRAKGPWDCDAWCGTRHDSSSLGAASSTSVADAMVQTGDSSRTNPTTVDPVASTTARSEKAAGAGAGASAGAKVEPGAEQVQAWSDAYGQEEDAATSGDAYIANARLALADDSRADALGACLSGEEPTSASPVASGDVSCSAPKDSVRGSAERQRRWPAWATDRYDHCLEVLVIDDDQGERRWVIAKPLGIAEDPELLKARYLWNNAFYEEFFDAEHVRKAGTTITLADQPDEASSVPNGDSEPFNAATGVTPTPRTPQMSVREGFLYDVTGEEARPPSLSSKGRGKAANTSPPVIPRLPLRELSLAGPGRVRKA